MCRSDRTGISFIATPLELGLGSLEIILKIFILFEKNNQLRNNDYLDEQQLLDSGDLELLPIVEDRLRRLMSLLGLASLSAFLSGERCARESRLLLIINKNSKQQ